MRASCDTKKAASNSGSIPPRCISASLYRYYANKVSDAAAEIAEGIWAAVTKQGD
jgi:hypothetical protein